MLEFRRQGEAFTLGYGGDVFNTAVYASRLGLDVKFFSATGDDHYSEYLLNAWRGEGIATDAVRILPNMTPSLYIIETDDAGERSFHYWRQASPFIKWLLPGDYLQNLPAQLERCDLIYFSGISLALLTDDDRALLLNLLKSYRENGGRVGFDPNYRARLWKSHSEAAVWMDRAYQTSDIALPSYDDEALLRQDSSVDNLIAHIQKLGVNEIVMKQGAQGATVYVAGERDRVTTSIVDDVIDTTAAGDSFNSGYLATRLGGGNGIAAAKVGCQIAGKVIQYRGAIISREATLLS